MVKVLILNRRFSSLTKQWVSEEQSLEAEVLKTNPKTVEVLPKGWNHSIVVKKHKVYGLAE